MVGCFVNTVVLRTDLADLRDAADLLARTEGSVLRAFAHAELPFDKVVEAVAPKRDPSYTPLVQATFGLRQARIGRWPAAEALLEAREVERHEARLDLTVWVEDDVDGPAVLWTYAAALFDIAAIAELHEGYQRELAALVAALEAPSAPDTGGQTPDNGEE